jgi:putative transposase
MIPLADRKRLVDQDDSKSKIIWQCEMLGINRSSLYYKPAPVSDEDLSIMRIMDELYLEDPTRGTRRYFKDLKLQGVFIGRDKARTLMQIMGIYAIYCKPRTTVIDPAKYKYPYLLRGLTIDRPNQVWQIDISYIPMRKGFMYLCAIIDVFSRYLVGWSISNTMDAPWVVSTFHKTRQEYGDPEIVNSDQGTQFTSDEWIEACKGIKISMDGKGRAIDNVYIERFLRTIKHDKIYLEPPTSGDHLYRLCDEFINYYNFRRSHSSAGDCPPIMTYRHAA